MSTNSSYLDAEGYNMTSEKGRISMPAMDRLFDSIRSKGGCL